jgi:ethanolamine phosphate phosphodiesterase
LLISDAQTRFGASSVLGSSARRLQFDLAVKKGWMVARGMRPDAIIFLGDMLASGKLHMSDEE